MTVEEAMAIKKKMDDERYEYYDLGEHRDDRACLDGNFTADELEAIAVLMRTRPE